VSHGAGARKESCEVMRKVKCVVGWILCIGFAAAAIYVWIVTLVTINAIYPMVGFSWGTLGKGFALSLLPCAGAVFGWNLAHPTRQKEE